MRILVLTSINPVIAGDTYKKILNKFTKPHQQKGILCFPYFAEIRSQLKDQPYIVTYFAMLKASMEDEMQKKLYNRKNMIVIGNTYRDQKFDIVIGVNEDIFDNYLEELKENENEEIIDFVKKINIDNLYNVEDCKIILPTINHLLLFLEGVFEKDEEKSKFKFKQ